MTFYFNYCNSPSFETLSNNDFGFMVNKYPNLATVDIELFEKDLTEDNVFGWTTENNDQHEIEIHNELNIESYITTLIHELVHVDQNVRELFDDEQRENEAYELETKLFEEFKDIMLNEPTYKFYERMLNKC